MIFIESPNNPLLKSTSLVQVNLFTEKYYKKYNKNIIKVVDNTICGPEFFKPNEFNVDLIIYSITKFISGHSDLVSGCVNGKKEYIDKIRVLRTIFGSIPDSDTCWLIQRSLSTLKIRMTEQCTVLLVLHVQEVVTPFCIVSYYMIWVTTSWTYTVCPGSSDPT